MINRGAGHILASRVLSECSELYDDLKAASCLFNLLCGALAEFMGADMKSVLQFPDAQDFDPIVEVLDNTTAFQDLRIDMSSGFKCSQPLQIYNGEFLSKNIRLLEKY